MGNPQAVLGIDPGVTGAVALVGLDGALLEYEDITNDGNGRVTTPQLLATLLGWSMRYEMKASVVENVGSMPKQGVSTTFKFGRAAGVAETLPLVFSLPVHLVTAAVWKKHHKLKGDKDSSRQLAIRLWPSMANTAFKLKGVGQARADAALIALYWLQAEALHAPAESRTEVEGRRRPQSTSDPSPPPTKEQAMEHALATEEFVPRTRRIIRRS